MQVTPRPRPSASIQEASSAASAPAALAAVKTTAAELVVPTRTVISPAVTAGAGAAERRDARTFICLPERAGCRGVRGVQRVRSVYGTFRVRNTRLGPVRPST